ncbi:hypothetical protein AWN76_005890 [Rhodothermaceae bacterium RA]|nr:hypothetical protein AWN76_005890 [Rhodothermaceae bacterium RA]
MTRLVRISYALAALLLAVAAATATPARAAFPDIRDIVKESFDVRPGGVLRVDMDHGNLEIEAGRGRTVQVEVERIVRAGSREEAEEVLRRHDLDLSADTDDVQIRSRYHEPSRFWGERNRLKVTIRVRVPIEYHVEFATGMGNVWIADLEGRIEGKTGAGNIEIEAIRGEVDLRSGSGNITVEAVDGFVEAATGAGNIAVRGVCGAMELNTGAGNVEADLTCQPEDDSVFTSGAGNVTVYVDAEIRCRVDAVAGMGTARTDFPLRVEGRWMKKSFEGRINGGGPELRLRAGVGNVTLLRRP